MFESVVKLFKDYDRKDDYFCKLLKENIKEIKPTIQSKLNNQYDLNFRLDYFKGQTGNMPIVPFFSLFLRESKWKHTKGFYIVFLFDRDIRYVYMTLAFGTENLGLYDIRSLNLVFRNMLNLDKTLIDLKSSSSRPKKYEASVLKGYRYSVENFSTQFSKTDFEYLLNLYQTIFECSIFMDILEMKEVFEVELSRHITNNKSKVSFSKKKKKISADQLKKANERNKEIGNAGEKFALEIENKRLISEGIPRKAKMIAGEDESAGFDILSYEFKNNRLIEKYIEVKTTVENKSSFYISKGELNFMDTHQDQYYVYLVNNFNLQNKSGNLVQLGYLEIEKYDFLPVKFYAKI